MKKKITMILLIITLSFIFIPNTQALECGEGTCYCNQSQTSCSILRNPRGDKQYASNDTLCGCSAIASASTLNKYSFCTKTSEIWQFVGYGLFALKIVVPLIIIVLGAVDFAKATISSDDKAVYTAAKTLVQRVIMGICIFFVPTIIHLVVNMVSEASGVLDAIEGCETCLLDPTSSECTRIKNTAAASRNTQS